MEFLSRLAPVGVLPARQLLNNAARSDNFFCQRISAIVALPFSALNIVLCPLRGITKFVYKVFDLKLCGAFKALVSNVRDGVSSIALTATLVLFVAISIFSRIFSKDNLFKYFEQKRQERSKQEILPHNAKLRQEAEGPIAQLETMPSEKRAASLSDEAALRMAQEELARVQERLKETLRTSEAEEVRRGYEFEAWELEDQNYRETIDSLTKEKRELEAERAESTVEQEKTIKELKRTSLKVRLKEKLVARKVAYRELVKTLKKQHGEVLAAKTAEVERLQGENRVLLERVNALSSIPVDEAKEAGGKLMLSEQPGLESQSGVIVASNSWSETFAKEVVLLQNRITALGSARKKSRGISC